MGQGIGTTVVGLTSTFAAKAEPTFTTTAASVSPTLGAEAASGTGWTLGAGWSGTFAGGFTHAAGSAGNLTYTLGAAAGSLWLVTVTAVVTAGEGLWYPSVGGSASFENNLWGGAAPTAYTFGLKATGTGDLDFVAQSAFAGTLSNISIKQVTGASASPQIALTDPSGTAALEVRTTTAALDNYLVGTDAGKLLTGGGGNIGIGTDVLESTVAGFWCVGIGTGALAALIQGSRNIAIGHLAQTASTTGDRNVSVGSFSLTRCTTGRKNIAVGSDALWYTTTGSNNVGIGPESLGGNTTGSFNIGIGEYTRFDTTTTDNSIAIGYCAQYHATGARAVAIGNYASSRVTTDDTVSVGHAAAQYTDGERNVAVGSNALKGVISSSSAKRNVAIGMNAGVAILTGGDYNTFVGSSAGYTTTTGASNILIGYLVTAPSATTSNHLNIGNAIYGDLSAKRIGLGTVVTPTARLHLPAGAAAASGASFKIDAGTLLSTPEAGAIEFDGTNLYFTTGAGVRKTITAA